MSALDPDSALLLLGDVALLIREEFRRSAQHLGLTQPQWRVLMQLSRAPGLNQRQLAERLEVHPVTINQIIDRLAAAGWVRRDPCPQDRRAVRLYLTEASGPMLVELNRIAEAVRAAALQGLDAAQRRQ